MHDIANLHNISKMRCTSPLLHLLALIPFTTAHDLVPNSVPEPSTRAPQTPSSTVKILVCGDSISQGSDFDFTWRYRLWEWFQSNTAAQLAPTLQFIGPYIGTFPTDLYHDGQNEPGRVPDWGAYHPSVDPAFDGAHFSLSSRPAWQAVGMVPVVVQAYQPDLVVLQLGFNDIAWWSAGPKGLVELMEQLVAGVRMGRPDVGVLVADVTSRTFMEGKGEIERMTRGYNALLALKIKEWSTPESPVTLVKVHDEYDCKCVVLPPASSLWGGEGREGVGERRMVLFFSLSKTLYTDRVQATSRTAQLALMDFIPTHWVNIRSPAHTRRCCTSSIISAPGRLLYRLLAPFLAWSTCMGASFRLC